MERLGERDRVLLGCAYRDPFGNLHHPPPPHPRNTDVDFADVFGGPPKRSSFYERRRSRADSLDSRARPRPLSAEKPAFGEPGSPARRRLLSDDFYDDIFPGSDSGSSTPRKLDRDPFPSTPGSRVLSPNRPVFVGGSSLPEQLSFPSTKLAKGVDKEDGDFDVSSFPYSPNAFRTGPAPDDPRNFAHTFHRQSPLATQLSRGTFRSSETLSKGSQSERYATSIEGYISSNQFHFSIHKWAGKGVSLSLSSRSKDTNGVNRYSRLPEVVIHTDDLPSDDIDDDEMSISTGLSNNQTNHSNKVLNEIFMENKHEADSTNPEDVLHEIDQNNLRKTYTGNAGTSVMNTAEVSATLPDIKRPELKNLHQIFEDEIGKDGSKELNKHAKAGGEQKGAANDVKVKNQSQRQNFVEHGDTISASMKNFPASLEEKMQGSRVKGKVKDFIKIFNVEGSPKRKGIFEGGDRKSKEKDRVKGKVEIQVNTSAAKSNEEVKVATAFNETFGIDPVEVDEILRRGGVPTLYMSSKIPLTNDSSSERNETQGLCSASTHESVKTYDSNVEESNFEDLDGCLVEQLSQEQTENQRLGLPEDQIQIANAKIREWSKGKEGNIRSLLSTLQYVLWSDSGWKPVPLVDIIEGNSVKRAYQRALLYLHPDKLQQRGAAEHQKYIAEKVFDILQVLSNPIMKQWDEVDIFTNPTAKQLSKC